MQSMALALFSTAEFGAFRVRGVRYNRRFKG